MKVMARCMAASVLLAAGVAQGAPLLVRMTFNDEAGGQSLANRGLITFSATLEGGAAYSTDLPPGRTSGRSIELFGGNNDRVNLGTRTELSYLRSYTITTWIKPKAFDAGKTYP